MDPAGPRPAFDSKSTSSIEKASGAAEVTLARSHIDEKAENALIRHQDLRILPVIALTYLLAFIDRTNLGNARVAGLEADLGLFTYDFNIGASLFYIAYLVFDIPCSLLVKKLGFILVPLFVVAFGIVTIGTAFITNRAGWFAVRFLLGIFEANIMPGTVYLLSRYYRRKELTARIGCFMLLAAGGSQAFGGLLASGLLSVPAIVHNATWRNIFLVEGIITAGLGLILLYLFPADPAKTRMFNEEQRKLALERIYADQAGIATHKEPISWKLIKKSIFNVNTSACVVFFICNNITVQGLGVFTPTILRLNYPGSSTVRIQLLAVPPAVVGTIVALTTCWIAMKKRVHAPIVIFGALLSVIGYGIWIGTSTSSVEARYAAIFLNTMAGYVYGSAVLGWAASNASPDTVRTMTGAALTGFGNVGSIVATWSYIPTDASTGYRIGNALNLSTGSLVCVGAAALWAYQQRENRVRERGGRDYRLTGTDVEDLGFHHPSYRYVS